MSSFNRKIISDVRKNTGATDTNTVPTSEIEDELDAAKAAISAEVQQRLNNGGSLELAGKAGEMALKYYLYLRVTEIVVERSSGSVPADFVSVPSSLGHIRQVDFQDTQMNFWRDRLIDNLNNI